MGGTRAQAEAVLLAAADKTGTLAAFYADTDGQVLAASNGTGLQDLAATPHFRRALQGALGVRWGFGTGSGGSPLPRRISARTARCAAC